LAAAAAVSDGTTKRDIMATKPAMNRFIEARSPVVHAAIHALGNAQGYVGAFRPVSDRPPDFQNTGFVLEDLSDCIGIECPGKHDFLN
jgi:hypothetical protein